MDVPDYIKETVEKVKRLEIQGARNIAKALLKVFIDYIASEEFKSREEMLKKSLNIALYIMDARPTEPMTRNLIKEFLNFTINMLEKEDYKSIKDRLKKNEEKIIGLFDNSIKEISHIGALFIKENSKIITHCHSSTVVSILKKAKDMGKEFEVYVSETRPKYQGRITARELADYGIDVNFYVDSSMSRFAKKADIGLVGADAISAEGDLVNKVGTLNLAIILDYYKKPLYSAAELYKFNPETLFGILEEIEFRDPKEIWEESGKINVYNPAFDRVPSKLIKAYITNTGIINSYLIKEEFDKYKKEMFKF